MTNLEFSSEIPATQKELFDFHCDFKNITIVTPPLISVRFASVPSRMATGSTMTVEIRQFGFWMPWDVAIESVTPDSIMIDYQCGRGPFHSWRHEHIFEIRDGRTFLVDRIAYQLPFGIAGRLFDRLVMRRVQKMVFSYRHKKTKEYFQKK